MARNIDRELDELSKFEAENDRRGIFAYFSIVFGKFMKLINVNFLFLAFSLVYILFLFGFSPINITMVKGLNPQVYAFVESFNNKPLLDGILRAMFAVFVLLLWGSGPASAGLAYILRNFSRREHAWIWADYVATIKNNFKQSCLVLLADVLVIYLSCVALNFYAVEFANTSMQVVVSCVIAFFLLLYTFMHFYLYQLMVTYEDKLIQHFRNAMLFAVMKWLPNLLILLTIGGITFALFYFFQLFALVPYVIVLTVILILVSQFYASRTIARVTEKSSK